jgi:hypothetical protein
VKSSKWSDSVKSRERLTVHTAFSSKCSVDNRTSGSRTWRRFNVALSTNLCKYPRKNIGQPARVRGTGTKRCKKLSSSAPANEKERRTLDCSARPTLLIHAATPAPRTLLSRFLRSGMVRKTPPPANRRWETFRTQTRSCSVGGGKTIQSDAHPTWALKSDDAIIVH